MGFYKDFFDRDVAINATHVIHRSDLMRLLEDYFLIYWNEFKATARPSANPSPIFLDYLAKRALFDLTKQMICEEEEELGCHSTFEDDVNHPFDGDPSSLFFTWDEDYVGLSGPYRVTYAVANYDQAYELLKDLAPQVCHPASPNMSLQCLPDSPSQSLRDLKNSTMASARRLSLRCS